MLSFLLGTCDECLSRIWELHHSESMRSLFSHFETATFSFAGPCSDDLEGLLIVRESNQSLLPCNRTKIDVWVRFIGTLLHTDID